MSYLDLILLNQELSYEAVDSRAADGTQDKSYLAAVTYPCREETIAEQVVDALGVEVLATSLVFIDPSIFTQPDIYARYTLPSGDVVRLAKAEAIKKITDTVESADTITHWEAYFTKA